ncbi:MAG TPA: xanthine dehydrogenase family protein molybdopterin-binding subunit, partial [Armatimonadetes bacterium]|nr:xanthine dehydrogenase family protein molybdopterin-binding subunit [Armatimonadota bacterium]
TFKETLRAAAEKSNWGKPLGKNRGRGIACGEWHHIVGASAAYVMLNQDGTVQVVTGSVDLTGTNTLFAQIVAEELSVPINAITVTVGDTDTVPFHHLTAGSRTTYATGTAVRRAARVARQKILAIAATELGVDANALELVDGKVRMRDNPEHTLTLAEVAELSIRNARGAIIGTATLADMPRRPVYSVHVVEIEIDPFTGIVTPLRIVAAQDVGRQLNPLLLEGQIQGGVVQALGYAMMEGAKYAPDGRMLNASFSDYPIPTAMDAPRIEHVIVEVPSPHGPYGAVGAGEPPMIPTAAAIANAIDDAIGVRVTELPITPERVIVAQRLNATKRT